MQIDHDPRELSHKAIKIVAVLALVVTIVIMVPLSMSIRWTVTQMPIEIVMLLAGVAIALPAGFFIGRWDALRGQRAPRDG